MTHLPARQNSGPSKADVTEITSILMKMLISFRERPSDPLVVVKVYVTETAGYGLSVIREASGKFMGDRVDGHNASFAPSVAEFARECRRISDDRAAAAAAGPRVVREVLKPIRKPWMKDPSWAAITRPAPAVEPKVEEPPARVFSPQDMATFALVEEMKEAAVEGDREKYAARWKEIGARDYAARGLSLDSWQASPELEALVAQQNRDREEPHDEGTP